MKIVGVGAAPGFLTEEAISIIENAEVIYGSVRALEIAKDHIKCRTIKLTDFALKGLSENAVVLSTGDPMLSGLGKYAKKSDEVIPGISSLQIACARLHLDIDTISVITAHSRDISIVKKRLISELNNKKNIFLLPDSSFGTVEISSFLIKEGFQKKIIIFENLGYPKEKISAGTTDNPPDACAGMYCMVIHS